MPVPTPQNLGSCCVVCQHSGRRHQLACHGFEPLCPTKHPLSLKHDPTNAPRPQPLPNRPGPRRTEMPTRALHSCTTGVYPAAEQGSKR